jgi:PST family polysaccharide transporter
VKLARAAVLGTLWTVAGSIGGRAIGLAGNLVLAALIAPVEFGAANVAAIVVQTVSTFTSPGFGPYLVATPDAGDEVAFHATFYSVVIGWVALFCACLLSSRIAPFFGIPSLPLLVPGLAVAAALDRLGGVPGRLIVRDMRFGVLGLKQLVGEATFAATAVALALLGWGATSIVAGTVARAFVGFAILALCVHRHRWLAPHPIRWSTTRTLFGFGIPVSVGNVLFMMSARWDNLVVAKLFGPAVVGQYNLSYNLADIPAAHVGEQMGDVLTPTFSKVADPAARRRALARVSGLLALIVFPMAVGLGAVAQTLRETFLDARWAMVGSMLAILSVLSVTRPVGWLVGAYLYARKYPRTIMLLEAFKAAMVLSMLLFLGRRGPLWACSAVGIAFGAYALASLWAVRYHEAIPIPVLVAPMARPLAACLPLAAAVLLVRAAVAGGPLDARWRLFLEVGAGVVGYGLAVLLIAAPLVRDARSLLSDALHHS